MSSDSWLDEQVKISKTRKVNQSLCRKNDIYMIECLNSHIEIYDNNEKLLKVLYSHSSLNFYLNSINNKLYI